MNPAQLRSVRNNNPGNVRVGAPRQGLMPREQMTPEQAAETAFCVFLTPVWGFRTMAEIFTTYAKKDGVRTVEEAINRWAPSVENNTAAYVQSVCDYTAYKANDPSPFATGNAAGQAAFLKAVSIHEAGGWFFQQFDLIAGIQAAR